jgi:hypothetical protein
MRDLNLFRATAAHAALVRRRSRLRVLQPRSAGVLQEPTYALAGLAAPFQHRFAARCLSRSTSRLPLVALLQLRNEGVLGSGSGMVLCGEG